MTLAKAGTVIANIPATITVISASVTADSNVAGGYRIDFVIAQPVTAAQLNTFATGQGVTADITVTTLL